MTYLIQISNATYVIWNIELSIFHDEQDSSDDDGDVENTNGLSDLFDLLGVLREEQAAA